MPLEGMGHPFIRKEDKKPKVFVDSSLAEIFYIGDSIKKEKMKKVSKRTAERRSISPSVNRTEPEKEEEAKLSHSIRDVRTILNQE